jgi:hypothetical protein
MRWLCIALLPVMLHGADLASIQEEPNLEKRSQLAVDYANSTLDTAHQQYQDGETAKADASLKEVGASVELAYQALLDTHKNPRRDPKYFKRTELALRQLLRRLEGMAESMSYEDRQAAEKVRDRVATIHDNLLQAIMKKK